LVFDYLRRGWFDGFDLWLEELADLVVAGVGGVILGFGVYDW